MRIIKVKYNCFFSVHEAIMLSQQDRLWSLQGCGFLGDKCDIIGNFREFMIQVFLILYRHLHNWDH